MSKKRNRLTLENCDDRVREEALRAYQNWEFDGADCLVKKGVDGYMLTSLNSSKIPLPYRVLMLEDMSSHPALLGARLAAGSPRVFVEYKDDDIEDKIIRISIDPDNPRILDGDESDCEGADFTKIYEFIKRNCKALLEQWNGYIGSSDLREKINEGDEQGD